MCSKITNHAKGERPVKFFELLSVTAALTLCTFANGETIIDNNLVEQMETVGPKGTVSALVYVDNQVDIKALSDSIANANMRFVDRHQLVV